MHTYNVLPLWQPWASLIFIVEPETGLPYKQIETRSKPIKPGKYLIHATQWNSGRIRSICANQPFRSILMKHLDIAETGGINDTSELLYRLSYQRDIEGIKNLAYGAIIGKVEIVKYGKVVSTEPAHEYARLQEPNGQQFYLKGTEYYFGDYSLGRYGMVMDNIKLFDTPIPFKANQGISKFTTDLIL